MFFFFFFFFFQAEDGIRDVAVTGVQTCALPILLTAEFKPFQEIDVMAKIAGYVKKINVDVGDRVKEGQLLALIERSEERRVGKECRSRWSPYHSKKKKKITVYGDTIKREKRENI